MPNTCSRFLSTIAFLASSSGVYSLLSVLDARDSNSRSRSKTLCCTPRSQRFTLQKPRNDVMRRNHPRVINKKENQSLVVKAAEGGDDGE
jgi:hypothetical protein